MKLLWRALEWPVGLLFWAWSLCAMRTARLRVTGPFGEGPAIYVHWHQHLPLLMPLCGSLRRRGAGPCWIMMSAAPRMAPIARWAKLVGLRIEHGATGENGRAALDRLADAIRRGESVELAVDGPAGPAFRVKPGCVDLALATGAPLVALAYFSSAAFRTPGRWDAQLMLPPFASVDVVACTVPRHDADTRETLLARVQETLEQLRP